MIHQVEQKIIETIKAHISDFKTVKGYEGEFASVTRKEILGMLPAALVVYEGSSYTRMNKLIERKMDWTVILVTESYIRSKAREEIYELLETTRECIENIRLDNIDMTPLLIKRERFIYRDHQLVAFGQTYVTKIFRRA